MQRAEEHRTRLHSLSRENSNLRAQGVRQGEEIAIRRAANNASLAENSDLRQAAMHDREEIAVEALRILETCGPSLILMDVQLPG